MPSDDSDGSGPNFIDLDADHDLDHETWLCEGCETPKPTEECWPCQTDAGRRVLCADCRDERGVDGIQHEDDDAE